MCAAVLGRMFPGFAPIGQLPPTAGERAGGSGVCMIGAEGTLAIRWSDQGRSMSSQLRGHRRELNLATLTGDLGTKVYLDVLVPGRKPVTNANS